MRFAVSEDALFRREEQVLRYIASQDLCPSHREIIAACGPGLQQGHVSRILDRLQAKGYIRRKRWQWRSIEVLRLP